ncbi:MAG: response regulator [Moraxellaceae bacterium]|jgi:serine/threonine-protein kinase|nr:response regulator [Moraxellaceae bacterium]
MNAVTEKPRILLVDDEERILRSLGMLLRMHYQVFATSDGHEALAILRREKIHVLISDQRMPVMTGTELLRQARVIAPDTIRILLTGYADADAALAAVNEGEIFRYINKPWGPKELRDTIAQAVQIAQQLDAPAAAATAATADTRLTCLVLDRDIATYQAVKELLEPAHEVLWRRTIDGALDVLTTQPVAILVTELSLGDEDLSAMLKTLKQEHPELLTIILTCFKDTSRLVELINQAQIYRYLPKPLRKGLLGQNIESTIARYRRLRAQPVQVLTQAVEKPQVPAQQQKTAQIAQYLGWLRSRNKAPA